MVVFFRNIPDHTTHNHLIEFIEPVIKVPWFRAKGTIGRIKLIELQDANAKTSEFHGLVTIEPDKVARKVIKKLNRKRFLGKHILVREYQSRCWHNDLRINHNPKKLKFDCRRGSDRRRGGLNVVEVGDQSKTSFSGDKAFHRHY